MEIIKEALARDQAALSEYDSKKFCASLGIPVCRETVAYDVASAVAGAVKIGFPVVLKASGEKLFHKTGSFLTHRLICVKTDESCLAFLS